MADSCQNTSFFDISVNNDRICMGFEADTPAKWKQHVHFERLSDKDLVKKLLVNNRISVARQNFFTRALSESRVQWTCCCHFSGISASKSMQIWSVLTEISKKVLLESTVSAIVALLKSCDSPRCSHTHTCSQPHAPPHIHLWQN